jgi:hypothetical protein
MLGGQQIIPEVLARMTRGLILRRISYPNPRRSKAPGRRFSTLQAIVRTCRSECCSFKCSHDVSFCHKLQEYISGFGILQVECDRAFVSIDSRKVVGNGSSFLFPRFLLAWYLPVTGIVLSRNDLSGCFTLRVAIASYAAIWILYLDHLCSVVCENLSTIWRLEEHQFWLAYKQ